MLRIHTVTSAAGAKTYYQTSDYYSEGQVTIGHWGGKLAERLGLHGTVSKEEFERLCDNLHPMTGERLTARTNAKRRVGYDFTIDAVKSFSVLVALAPPDLRRELMQAFNDAIRETAEQDIEPDMQTRIRIGGQEADRKTGNALWAWFGHSTSRPVGGQAPDPQIHAHLLFFNATEDAVEGRIKAGQFAGLKRDGEYYHAIIMSRLASRLEAMGFSIKRLGGTKWEIAGMPQSVINKFSKRTAAIEAEHQDRMLSDPNYRPEDKYGLGAKTREKKAKELTQAALRDDWDGQLTQTEREALEAIYRREGSGSAVVTPRQAVSFALAHCFENESLVPEREIVAAALFHGLGHVTADAIRREMDRQGVLTGLMDGRLMATTREVRREEEFMVAWAGHGLDAAAPVGIPKGLQRGKLDDEQWQAVCGLLASGDRLSMVDSAAGTGKSTMLAAFDEGMRRAGARATYLGTTASSVKVLEKDGLKASTVAAFLLDERRQEAARGGKVIVDEASMLGHKDAHKLIRLADEKGFSLVMLGDSRQHGSVPRGALMRILQQYGGIRPFCLTAIKRQQDAGYLEAVDALSKGRTVEGFDRLAAKGWVKEIEAGDERCRAMAEEYVRAAAEGQTVLCVAPTHAEAGLITEAIRAGLRDAGRLAAEEREFTRLVAVEASEAERGLEATYQAGDIIQFHQNAGSGFEKGDRFIVGDPAAVPVHHADKFSVYRPQKIALAAGDVLRFTGTVRAWGSHTLRNGDVHTVQGFTPAGNIRLENGWVVRADAGHFRSGFVETSMGAQGRTVQKIILGMSSGSMPAMNAEQMYVSASRARQALSLYTDAAADIREAIGRSSAKKVALDLVPPAPGRDQRREQRERRRLWALHRRRGEADRPMQPQRSKPASPGWARTHARRASEPYHDRGQAHGR